MIQFGGHWVKDINTSSFFLKYFVVSCYERETGFQEKKKKNIFFIENFTTLLVIYIYIALILVLFLQVSRPLFW